MKSNNTSRKAHSATKIYENKFNLFTCERKPVSRKLCLSASCLTRQYAGDSNDDENDYFNAFDNVTNKSLLKASQLLEKLKKLKSIFSERCEFTKNENINKRNIKFSSQQIVIYHETLKNLLEQRYILLFKEEINFNVKKCRHILLDLKLMYNNEIIKLTTLPINSYHRFIDISGLTMNFLERFFKKLNFIYDLNLSIKNNYRNIINFHKSFDMELHQRLMKTYSILNELYMEIILWSYKILDLFILKLCLSDPDSLSPEFLHHILDIFKSFNLFLLNRQQLMLEYCSNLNCFSLNYCIHSDYEKLLLDLVLKYLSYFEAKVASTKLVHFLSNECKKQINYKGREKDVRVDLQTSDSKTSDYLSASPSVIESEGVTVSNSISSFASIFFNFVQRNQSLILKYFYSIICLNASNDTKQEFTEQHCTYLPKASQRWNLPQWENNSNYNCFEKQFWMQFWKNVYEFSLKMMIEALCHQYGNANIGAFVFWPHQYHLKLSEFFKLCIECEEFLNDGVDVIKSLQNSLTLYSMHNVWDKSISSAICSIDENYFIPVSTTVNRVRTRSSNALSTCIETFMKFLPYFRSKSNCCFQFLHQIQVAMDCFLYMIAAKVKSSIASRNYFIFMLVSCSDCEYVCRLLKEDDVVSFLSKFKYSKWFWIEWQKQSFIRQVETLNGFVVDAPHLVHKITSDEVRKTVFPFLRKFSFRIDTLPTANLLFNSLNEILFSLSEATINVPGTSSLISVAALTLSNEFLFILSKMKHNLSLKKIQVMRKIFIDFLKWMEQLNLSEEEMAKLGEMKCLRRVLSLLQIAEFHFGQPYSCLSRNKVSPVLDGIPATEDSILTEEEKQYWQIRNFRKCF